MKRESMGWGTADDAISTCGRVSANLSAKKSEWFACMLFRVLCSVKIMET